ncbi:uncharacterized protein CEXT_516741 [Caerostris extrusa]|uniref:Uncharacterized protein n=1 Tax=Caerostris extrusa TaxID=172846 RepID=A0AAV4V176_CAEEX|nr:uncharacterized protein CEXT_516741 [Caerostris extrusa]
MDYQLPVESKKNRSSFWGKLFGTSKKSNSKERKDGDSFQRQSSLYHSFHFTSAPQESNESQEEGNNFTTLESSALMDIHKDTGILFLNKDSIANCMMPKEEDKHVQFAPTPMNKYYRVDVKAASISRPKFEENKENLKLVSVSYIDGPEVKKTPIIPRTSTKLALFDRKNGSSLHLNVSGIAKYGSLPRTARKKFCWKMQIAHQIIPDLARHVDQNHLGQQSHLASNQSRLSKREQFHPEMNSFNVVVCYDPNCEVVKNNPLAKQQINSAVMEADRAAKRGNRRHEFLVPGQMSRETSASFATKGKIVNFLTKQLMK